MRTIVEICNLTKKRINPDLVKKVVRKAVKMSGIDLNSLNLSVVFVGEAESRKINRKYRQKKKSTDVLSFNLDSGYNKNKRAIEGPPRLAKANRREAGELVLCPDVIEKNARESKVNFSRELAFVLAHGVLHILGWRHGVRMFNLQDKVVQSLRITN